MPVAAIFWNIPRNHQNSMGRYAERLSNGLRVISANSKWQPKNVVPRGSHLPGNIGRVSELATRFFSYPIRAWFTEADLFHIVDHGYGQLAYPLQGRKLVITCNDLMTFRIAQGTVATASVTDLSVRKFRWIASGLRFADAVIAISNATRKDIIRYLGIPDDRIHVIYMGVDHTTFQRKVFSLEIENLRQKIRIPPEKRIILHISGVSPYKNIEGVLHTIGRLYSMRHDICLLRVGERLTPKLWALARELSIKQQVFELGHISDHQLATAYNLADALLFPSWWEGFGLPPLEAMACGTPVIVSNRASLPEVVSNDAIAFSPDNYDGMASAICRVLDDVGWRQSLIERGLVQSRQFTWEETTRKTLRVYESVLHNDQT